MGSNWILLFILIASFTIRVEGLRLVNNGYENLYIVIQESVSEDPHLVDRIQEIFRNASSLLYRATHKRTYFRNLKLVVPKTWSTNVSYKTVSALSAFKSHIRIGNNYMTKPVTVGSETCGQEGLYTYLHAKEFILKDTTSWGPHDHVIVHEWGHLRWGLKDEYPTLLRPGVGDKNTLDSGNDGDSGIQAGEDALKVTSTNTVSFFQADQKWNPVGCTRDLLGFASTSCKTGIPEGKCDTDNLSAMMGADCKFCPSLTQPFNASIMSLQYIPPIEEFCDKDDPETPSYMRHDSRATNEQNLRCEGRSCWEVMREHEDFKNGKNSPLPDDQPPLPIFEVFQSLGGKVRVFVLDTSGSMNTDQRITKLQDAARFVIEIHLPLGSWLGLVEFDTHAYLISKDGIIQIDSDARRQEMVSLIPPVRGGSTCIGCGLNMALSLLRNFTNLDSIQGSEIILISDGQNNNGDLELATQNCVEAEVVVHCITVTEAADQRLVNISARTGGKVLSYSRLGSISLASLFSEVISGGVTVDASVPVTMYNEQIFSSQNVPVSVTFNVDDGIGQDLTVTVISEAACDLDVALTGPNRFLQNERANYMRTLSLLKPGLSEKGTYIANVTCSVSSKLEVFVTSKPLSLDAEVIRPLIRISDNHLDFTGSVLPILYVHLRKGESPVKMAVVKAVVENSEGNKTCELALLDDGLGADIKAGDGVYSAVLLRDCQSGNGRHSSKVFISGTGETKVSNNVASGSALIDLESAVTIEMPTGSFERVAVAEAYTVSNYNTTVADKDITPPGWITDVQVIDIKSDVPSTGSTRYYTITWTATGDDANVGQANSYEMRISNDRDALRQDFLNAQLLKVNGVNMAPKVSGKIERLVMVVSSDKAFTTTTYFAIVAVDEAQNRGRVSNIIPIAIDITSQIKVIEEECTDNCYDIFKDCGRSFTVENGYVNFTDTLTRSGNSATVVCDIGFNLTGGSSIECLENGTWSTGVSCQIVDCGGASIVKGGIVFYVGTKYGDKAFVSCDDGYRINGSDTITCLSTGLWSTDANCVPKDCGMNFTLPNGLVDFKNGVTTFGQSLPIVCVKGYKLTGGNSIRCQVNGEWETRATCEIVDCRPTTVVNGEVLHSKSTNYNATAAVNCDAGYEVEGTGFLVCLATGLWSKESRCKIKDCGNSETISNGQINFTNAQTTYRQSVTVICDIGYKRTGGSSIECLADGTWSKSVTCEIVDCGGTSISNAAVSFPEGTNYNANAKLNCDVGFRLTGAGIIRCLNTGLWSTDSECLLVDCGANFSLTNGKIDFSNALTTYRQLLPVICDEGYVAQDKPSIECLANGLWSLSGKCEIVDCGHDIILDHGHGVFTDAFTTYGQSVRVSCNTGYRSTGDARIECLANGTWSTTARCEIIDCGHNVTIKNGQVNLTAVSTTYGQQVMIQCYRGYKVNGDTSLTCLANASWTRSVGCELAGDAETMKFKTVTIIASSVGLLFFIVIGFLLHSVFKHTKKRKARKRYLERIRKYIYMPEKDDIEANPDYETDSSIRCTHGMRGFQQNNQYGNQYETPRELYSRNYWNGYH